jgi:hypothetical protein
VVLNITSEGCPVFDRLRAPGLPAECRVALDEQVIPTAELPSRVAEVMSSRPADQHVLFLAADERLRGGAPDRRPRESACRRPEDRVRDDGLR